MKSNKIKNNFSITIPFYPFSHHPLLFPLHPFNIHINSLSILLPIYPLSRIFPSIRPFKHPFTMLNIFDIIPLKFSSIHPLKYSFPMHFIIISFTSVFSAICPNVSAKAMNIIRMEITFIC